VGCRRDPVVPSSAGTELPLAREKWIAVDGKPIVLWLRARTARRLTPVVGPRRTFAGGRMSTVPVEA
jgi:hypothetical protein